MMVKVKWFYHPEEIETTGKKFDLKLPVRYSFMSTNKYNFEFKRVRTILNSCFISICREVCFSLPIRMKTTCKQFLTNARFFQWRNILEWWWTTQQRDEKCNQVILIISQAHMIQPRVRYLFKLELSSNNKS